MFSLLTAPPCKGEDFRGRCSNCCRNGVVSMVNSAHPTSFVGACCAWMLEQLPSQVIYYEGDELNIHTSNVYLMALLGLMRHHHVLCSQWLNLNLPHTALVFLAHYFSFLCINNAFINFFFRICFLLHFLPAELLFPRTDLTGGAPDLSLLQLVARAHTRTHTLLLPGRRTWR